MLTLDRPTPLQAYYVVAVNVSADIPNSLSAQNQAPYGEAIVSANEFQEDTRMKEFVAREKDDRWSDIYDELSQWMRNPSMVANEDGESPSKFTILVAQSLAEYLEKTLNDAPVAVVPEANNMGIVFDWRLGNETTRLKIMPDGTIEQIKIRNGRLRYREPYKLARANEAE